MNYTLITGASSGIGNELALQFAKNGHNLILLARNGERLKRVSVFLEKEFKISALVIPIDLSHPGSADEIFKWVMKESITVEYLVNNAGFYIQGDFSGTSWEDEKRLIQLQCITHTSLIKLLLPEMTRQGKGGILNVGSTGSFVPGPHHAVYCAVKGFVLSLSEALSEELSGTGITVTALCPGGTNTNFWKGASRKNSFLFPMTDAALVAEAGYNGLMKGKRIVIPGMMNRLYVFLVRFFPRKLLAGIAGRLARDH